MAGSNVIWVEKPGGLIRLAWEGPGWYTSAMSHDGAKEYADSWKVGEVQLDGYQIADLMQRECVNGGTPVLYLAKP